MHLRGLDLNLLVVLDALLTEQSTTRAGQRVYLSQSATSGALARLRDYFGDQLLVPSAQGMIRTPFAESLIRPVKDILAGAESLIGKVKVFHPATSARLFVLNMSDVTATLFLANSMPRLRELAPGVHVEIVTNNEKIPDIIEQGDVDFIEVPDVLASTMHPKELLFEDEYVCLAWSGNKSVKKGLTMETFLSLGHVTMRFLRRREHLGEALLQDSGVKARFELVVPVFNMIPHAVVNTDLIALVNSRLARFYAKFLPLKIFPSPVKIRNLRMMLQWNRYSDANEGTQWMKRLLLSTLRPPDLK